MSTFITNTLGLTKLPPYLPTFALSFLGFLFVHQVLSPWCSRRWFSSSYDSKNDRARNNWSIHVVSQVHTIIIVPLSLWVLYHESPSRTEDRAFGWSEETGFVHAVACGYFLWDSLDAIVNFIDIGFVAHGLACFAIYFMTYKPFVAYYGTRCLLWETSTFFLNIHWFMDKTGRAGSISQLVNGFFLLSSFFGVRIIYGGMVSYQFMRTLAQIYDDIPRVYVIVFAIGNVLLQSLNWFWFYKMIRTLRHRFTNTDGTGERGRLVNGEAHRSKSES